MQDELDCELVIAAGAETETRRIQEIISEESSHSTQSYLHALGYRRAFFVQARCR